MRNRIIGLVLKWSGASKLWGWLDGKKTNIAGFSALLTGLAGVVAQLVPILAAKDFALLIAFAQGLPADPAFQMLLGGLATLGIAGKVQKIPAPAESPKP